MRFYIVIMMDKNLDIKDEQNFVTKLSVVVPVYNVIDTLDRCVSSILRQGMEQMNVILVDDGSTDGSSQRCDEWASRDARITALHKKNGGLSDARNYGLDEVNTEYVTFVDSDDFLQDNTYAELLNDLEAHPEYDILEFPVFVHFSSEREHVLKLSCMTYDSFDDYWIKGRGYTHAYAWNKIYRTALFKDVRYPVGMLFEDIHIMPVLFRNVKCMATTNTGVYYYCMNKGGITATADSDALKMLLNAYVKVVDKHPGFLDDNDFYMEMVNRQIDVYVKTGEKPIVKSRHVKNICGYANKSSRCKARAINIIGLHNLCRLIKWKTRLKS